MTGSRAFVDETWRRDDRGRYYILLGVVVDDSVGARPLMAEFHAVAARWGGSVHATEMCRTQEGRDDLAGLERSIEAAPAIRLVCAVRAPIPWGARRIEAARQRCVAELSFRAARLGVRELVFDSRNSKDPHAAPQERRADKNDQATILDLRRAGELPDDVRAWHRDDRHTNELWLADVACRTVRDALLTDDPIRLSPLAHLLEIREARLLPVSERSGLEVRAAPESGLSFHLADLVMRARRVGSEPERGPSSFGRPHGSDWWRDRSLGDHLGIAER
ncbi:MAG: hypothetical protein LBL55_11260 [Propionibacteriaceae bacterium]|nr:hypothetical protein [Propionibacteriaceae bacterium]